MPHSSPRFFLLLTVPSDTDFTSKGSCSGTCLPSYSMVNATTLNITVNNSLSSNTSFYNYSLTLGTFTTPRQVGTSLSWGFTTYNLDGSQVGTGSSTL